VILCGGPGPLLDWVAWGFATANPGGYFWTDVRMAGQAMDARGPLGRGRIPADHLSVVTPPELSPNDAPANAAISALLHADEPRSYLQQLADFLRLPEHTRTVISERRIREPPVLLVLSNGHRIAAQYPVGSVGPLVRAIVAAGASLFLTYADEPPEGRSGFSNIWHVQGGAMSDWPSASLEVEAGTFEAPFTTGARVRLADLPRVAGALRAL
jgi:hypothetical protein